ncbi:MAG: ATP-dependent DNA ligase [Candidatus Micrarchaeota archaeon]|nr:ATP-dependent DNA ligase [Candidatus Micrarchaeota archaeon]
MLFKEFVQLLEEVSKTRSRLRIVALLSDFFKKLTPEEARYVAYLLKGEVAPPYKGIDLNVADRTLLHVFAKLTGINVKEIEALYKKLGDIGDLAYEMVKKRKTQPLFTQEYEIKEIYEMLLKLATLTGPGSQQYKENLLLSLFLNLSPEEARYLARIIVGKTRVYIGVATILEAIANASGYSKEEVERAYYLISDIGKVAEDALKGQLEAKVRLFYPISPALAERAKNVSDLHAKIPQPALEYKYDGFRVQIHKSKEGKVKIYSRRLEDITQFLPDVVRYAQEIEGEYIMEGESISYDPNTQKFLPFQFTIRRKRKYDVQKYEKEFPLHVYIFDVLYKDGEEILYKPFKERREVLENLVKGTSFFPSHLTYSDSVEKTQEFFQEAVSKGLEGIIGKKPEQPYTPGQRNHNWIKLKKDAVDTIDGLVVGYFYGQGKLKDLPGSLLVALYNEKEDKFQTIAKVSSGLSEEEYKLLKELLKPAPAPPTNLEYHLEPDVWVVPEVVVELTYDDITISSMHTCDIGGQNVALRFPRVLRIRDDKSPEEVTTCSEVKELYEIAKK